MNDDELKILLNDYAGSYLCVGSASDKMDLYRREKFKEIKSLFKHGVCADCNFYKKVDYAGYATDGYICSNREYIGEGAKCTGKSLMYSYEEGGEFEPETGFGCIHFEPKEQK